MKLRIVKYLCCLKCKNEFSVQIKKKKGEEVETGFLICKKCRTKYPIIKGIPIILEGKKLKDYTKTKSNWENWWRKVRKKSDIELYDRLWIKAEKNLGAEPLYKKEMFQNKIMLDAGCGSGRYIKSDFLKYNCKEIFAVDLGRAVFQAKKSNNAPNTHFIQADLTNLPFKNNVFDVIASHGVLHHTPNPKKTFVKLSKHLKNKGCMAIYVYHKEWAYFKSHKKSLFLDALYANGVMIWQGIRKLVSRMPHPLIMGFVYCMAIKASIGQSLEENKITRPLGKIINLIPPFAYLGVNFHERLVRNYDHYSATFNYFQSIEEVVDWFREAGFDNLEVASIPVSIRGVKKNKGKNLKGPITIKQHPLINHFDFREEWNKLYNLNKK